MASSDVLAAPTDEFMIREVTEFDVTGDQVEALIVPWMKPTRVVDFIGDRMVAYDEQFAPGAFDRAEQVPHRVTFVWTHSDDFGNVLGRARSFARSAEGEVGVFRLAGDVDKTRDLIGDMGLSVSFRSMLPAPGAEERPGALVTRSGVHLKHVAVVAEPAYADARILAIREQAEEQARALAARELNDSALESALQLLVANGRKLSDSDAAWLQSRQRSTSA